MLKEYNQKGREPVRAYILQVDLSLIVHTDELKFSFPNPILQCSQWLKAEEGGGEQWYVV